jgi:hypothetical protein
MAYAIGHLVMLITYFYTLVGLLYATLMDWLYRLLLSGAQFFSIPYAKW